MERTLIFLSEIISPNSVIIAILTFGLKFMPLFLASSYRTDARKTKEYFSLARLS
jgi:hypothetical protein